MLNDLEFEEITTSVLAIEIRRMKDQRCEEQFRTAMRRSCIVMLI